MNGLDDLKAHEGEEVGVSEWHEVTQEAINEFAEVTGDHNWIHIDVERAKETPFGGTIAHGYYTLSLAPQFSYACSRRRASPSASTTASTRFASPPRSLSASKVRMRMKLAKVEDVPGGAQITSELTFEREGEDKPVCVAESLSRVYGEG